MVRRVLLPLTALAFAMSLATACAAPPPPAPAAAPDTTAADAAAVNKLRDDYAAAFKAGEAERVSSLLTADATTMQLDAPTVSGRTAQLEALKGMFSQVTVNEFTIKSDEMRLMGDYAFDRGIVSASMTPKAKGAKAMTAQTRYLVILHREADGAWRLVQDINNPVPPPPPPAKAGK
jgi:uncharacterized protein (TIGR02246 family)